MKKPKKVLVAMSGGVDSSVTAALLKKKGYEIVGIYMNFWSDPTVFEDKELVKLPQNKCCSIESLNNARSIAAELNIPFYVLNVKERFKKQIVDYFIDTYKMCRTPNPCVECNRNIKFGFLIERMKQLNCDYVATGHFARIKKKNNKYSLYMGKDKIKDQSYFLYTLNQEKLKHILFPVGSYTKEQVKKLAKKFGFLKTAEKKESQGVCFFPDKKYEDFLKRHFDEGVLKKGPIETIEGEKIGEHKGLQLFTIGQRKGIEIGGEKEPLYVVSLDHERNALIVGKNEDLYQKTFTITDLTFTEDELKDGKYKIKARIRYRFPPQKAVLTKEGHMAKIEFEEPQRAITPGQSVVFYINKRVLGGGIIDKVVV
jgi:tRNA-specific 2-thiouridylase